MAGTVREQRKAETREALLRAGRAVFTREGFHRASLDRVAAEAGFTKGAVYAHFPTKADLLLAVYEERSAARAAEIRRSGAGTGSVEEARRGMVADWARVVEQDRDWSLLLVEFWVHAAREPALRDRLRAAHLQVRAAIADVVAAAAAAEERELPVDAGQFATTIMALGNGMNLEAFLGEPDVPAAFDRASRLLDPWGEHR